VRAIDQVIKSRGKSSGISGIIVGDMSYIVTRLFSKEQPTKWGHRPLLYRDYCTYNHCGVEQTARR
jgi:hypothetical protein